MNRACERSWLLKKLNYVLLTLSKTHFIWSHRQVIHVLHNLIDTFSKAKLKPSQLYFVLTIEEGGAENIRCTEIALEMSKHEGGGEKNWCPIVNWTFWLNERVEWLIFFIGMKFFFLFFYCCEVDDDGKLKNYFLANGISKKIYQHFSNVLVFDTTYDTSKYSFIFLLFTRVNHHKQTITFGCVFLCVEKTETFMWLFETFRCMVGKHPRAIITDKCPAIKKIISNNIPENLSSPLHLAYPKKWSWKVRCTCI